MINQTRITVDEATKKVLDDFNEHFSRPPSWVAPLSEEIQEAGEVTRNALSATTKSVAKINDAVATLHEQIVSQAESHAESQARALANLSGAMKGIGEHLGALEAGIRNQSESVADMQTSSQRVLAASEQGATAAIQQRDIVQAMSDALQAANQQQEKRAAELIAALQSTNALLRELQSEQVKQRDALQSVTERVERLSKPWWKKLF
jgi:chromosome segregation ATPase